MALFDGAERSGLFRLHLTPPPIVTCVCVGVWLSCCFSVCRASQLTNEETLVVAGTIYSGALSNQDPWMRMLIKRFAKETLLELKRTVFYP